MLPSLYEVNALVTFPGIRAALGILHECRTSRDYGLVTAIVHIVLECGGENALPGLDRCRRELAVTVCRIILYK